MAAKEENIILGFIAAGIATAFGAHAYQRATETPRERKARLKREAVAAKARAEYRAEQQARDEARREVMREKALSELNDPLTSLLSAFSGDKSFNATRAIIATEGDWQKELLFNAYKKDKVKFSEVQKHEIRQSFSGLSWGIR